MGVVIQSYGSFKNTDKFLRAVSKANIPAILKSYGQRGVDALSNATPTDTGMAANSWGYEVENTKTGYGIVWTNTDVENDFPVVIRLQYGYATGTGGYIEGRDFINPAIQPIFDEIEKAVWKAVTSA